MQTHIVQKGETLWRIAKQYGIGLDELKRLNTHLANPDYIVPGMEIILPEGGTANPKSSMTKGQQTAPMPSKEMMTAPKEKLTRPVEKEQPVKEVPKKMETAPIPAPIPQPMPVPMPMPMPAPQVDLMPQFQFDFAPQMHFEHPKTLPAPAPMPMPQPQPIYIQVPQPKVETKVEQTVEKEVEYVQVPVPQPQVIYVCCPQPQPMPCGCHEKMHHHNPCHEKMHHHHPCGCHEQVYYHNPCGCQEQHYHQPHPYGFDEYGDYDQAPYGYNEQDYQQMPQQHHYDCGCGGGGYPSQEMMHYGMDNFEPNYDMAPMTNVAPAMEEPYEDQDGLPDWLLDSSEVKANMVVQDYEQGAGAQSFDDYNPYDPMDETGQGANPYQEGYNYGNSAAPSSQNYYGSYDMQPGMQGTMQHMMPQHMMPQQMMPQHMMSQNIMPPNCQGYPYNPYSSQNNPWNY
ncbi:LysM peptidoglycan-binding domain-containing protein [Ureibacillus aquaedulcis]|uniref:LysM peptidoglycan-binding domain-containing protein n=1 Tax=Ureibacillus aquaedulcis TaxID=3058421 RepID=A0ABT8GT08_9BACL|nr:LysM peptidoglycan-binding domain-containing protein [Ureibacillus sp. BA0131]MDN4494555.1 LysM peptidoglycan-binding domain-containing protein [Ureibacillus sp. BA0131]